MSSACCTQSIVQTNRKVHTCLHSQTSDDSQNWQKIHDTMNMVGIGHATHVRATFSFALFLNCQLRHTGPNPRPGSEVCVVLHDPSNTTGFSVMPHHWFLGHMTVCGHWICTRPVKSVANHGTSSLFSVIILEQTDYGNLEEYLRKFCACTCYMNCLCITHSFWRCVVLLVWPAIRNELITSTKQLRTVDMCLNWGIVPS